MQPREPTKITGRYWRYSTLGIWSCSTGRARSIRLGIGSRRESTAKLRFSEGARRSAGELSTANGPREQWRSLNDVEVGTRAELERTSRRGLSSCGALVGLLHRHRHSGSDRMLRSSSLGFHAHADLAVSTARPLTLVALRQGQAETPFCCFAALRTVVCENGDNRG